MRRVVWRDSYAAEYDDSKDQVFTITLPGNHSVGGPAGTLIGFLDLVKKVLEAIDRGEEVEITGAYRLPPSGFFFSRTRKLDRTSRIGRHLQIDWDDPDRIWYAEMPWRSEGDDYYVATSVGVRTWRQVSNALEKLMAYSDIAANEIAKAVHDE